LARDHARDLQHGRHSLGCAALSRIDNDNTHWRTGTWGMTRSSRCAAV
jgi:hypothetical protein